MPEQEEHNDVYSPSGNTKCARSRHRHCNQLRGQPQQNPKNHSSCNGRARQQTVEQEHESQRKDSLALGSQYAHLSSVSPLVAEAGVSRGLQAGREEIAEVLLSRSDRATSCLIISAFSHLSAFLGSLAHAFANLAIPARPVATPMRRNTRLIISLAFLMCVTSEQFFNIEIVPLLELQDVGYEGCCPEPAFAVSSCRDEDVALPTLKRREPVHA